MIEPSNELIATARREVRAGVRPAAAWVLLQIVGIVVGLTLVGRHGGGPLQGIDDTVHRWFLDHRSGLVGLSLVIAKVGDAPELGAIIVVATVVLALLWRNRTALLLFAAYLGAEATVYVIRQVIHRPRPITANFPAPGAVPGVHETGWSFPSGHATAVTAVVVALVGMAVARWGRRSLWILAPIGSLLAAGSRLVLGVHWFSDVTTGAILGALWGIVALMWLGGPSRGHEAGEPRPNVV